MGCQTIFGPQLTTVDVEHFFLRSPKKVVNILDHFTPSLRTTAVNCLNLLRFLHFFMLKILNDF